MVQRCVYIDKVKLKLNIGDTSADDADLQIVERLKIRCFHGRKSINML
jgi:hypothetical protein